MVLFWGGEAVMHFSYGLGFTATCTRKTAKP